MHEFLISYEPNTGTIGFCVFHAYDLEIALGGVCRVKLCDLEITIKGGARLSEFFGEVKRLSEVYRTKIYPLPHGISDGESERKDVPQEYVDALRMKAVSIVVAHFNCHPECFVEYMKFRDGRMRAFGACIQAKKMREALMIEPRPGGFGLDEPDLISDSLEGGWSYEK